MPELKLIKGDIPRGSVATPYALMPKIFCCIIGAGAEVYINRKKVRTFKYYENGLKKIDKVFLREEAKALKIFKGLTQKGPILLHTNKIV